MSSASLAQTFPTKPVRLIVTYPPGGSSDLMSRVYGAKLAELWGQQVIIESKPGAAGSIGMDFAAKQPNDGYTFVVGNLGPVAVNPLLSKVPYSIEKDFIAVSMISTGPNVLVVRTDSEFKSLNDIIAYARKNPGKLNYGTSGPGSVSHLSSEMLKNNQKVDAVEVAYKGGVLAIQDLLGGQIQYIFSDSLPAMAHIRGGKLRALCVTGSQRYALLPEPPLCQEAAPGPGGGELVGRAAARRQPEGDRRQAERRYGEGARRSRREEALRRPRRRGGVEHAGASSRPSSRDEMAKYAKLIKEANIKVNP